MAKSLLGVCLAALLMAPAAADAQTARPEPFVTVQPEGQWLASLFIGQPVSNEAGERVGDINDLLFDKSGRIVNVVIGVGGFLGIGEKSVAVPYSALSITAGADGKRVVGLAQSKEQLKSAPDFKPTEKTVYMRAKDRAGEIGRKAFDDAGELTDKAAKKLEEMRR
jgi:sporulation protein YlmC with PRC-barrel domain